MLPASTEKQELFQLIDRLHEDDVGKVFSYASYLRFLEEREDAEDIACAEAREDEPAVPLSDVLKDYEEKYGALRRV
jgi:hypothetical protein